MRLAGAAKLFVGFNCLMSSTFQNFKTRNDQIIGRSRRYSIQSTCIGDDSKKHAILWSYSLQSCHGIVAGIGHRVGLFTATKYHEASNIEWPTHQCQEETPMLAEWRRPTKFVDGGQLNHGSPAEVFHHGRWGWICADVSSWDTAAAEAKG